MTHLGEHLVTFLNGKHDLISTVLNPFFFLLLTGCGAEPHDSKRIVPSGIFSRGSSRKPFKLT